MGTFGGSQAKTHPKKEAKNIERFSSWQEPSKLLVNLLEARLLVSNWQPRLPGNPLHPPAESRNPVATKSRLNCSSANFTSNVWLGRSLRISRPICVSFCRHWRSPGSIRGLPRWSFRGHQLVRHPRQACDHHAHISNWPAVSVVNVLKYDVQVQMETFFQISSLLMYLSASCTTPRILFFHLYIINHNSFHF